MKRDNPEFFVMLLGMKSTLSCCGVSLSCWSTCICLHGGQLLLLWEEEASTREVGREGGMAF